MENGIFEKLKKTLCEFVKIPSVAGVPEENAPCGKDVADALLFVMNLSKDLGFQKFGEIDGYVGFAEVGEGEKCFGVLGHVDVVPAGEGWSFSPWSGEIIDEKICGRGALDDKGPLLAAIFAVYALLCEGYKPKCRIRFIFGCDEETGGKNSVSGWESIDRYLRYEKMPDVGISPDADFPVINAEKGILNLCLKIKTHEDILSISGGTALNIVPNYAKVVLRDDFDKYEEEKDVKVSQDGECVVIEAVGKNAHAARADKGDNAILKLIQYLARKNGDVYTEIADRLSSVWGDGIGVDVFDQESGRLTQNVGKIELVDGELCLYTNIRYPVTKNAEQIVEIIKEKWSGEVNALRDQKPLYLPKDHFLVKELLDSYNTITGESAEPIAIGGGTYARALPCGVAFGALFPGQLDNMHAPDECIELKYLYKACEIYYDAFKKLCFEKKD